jgi:hypothetical protein
MLVIRDVQTAALAASARERFIDRLVANVPVWFPREQDQDPVALRARVRAAVAEAVEHGMETERLAALFVAVTWYLGDGFAARLAWARELLARPVSAERKMRLVMDRAHEAPAAEAEDA